jgi:DMSO reductase family type II enzyme chaperone
MQAHLQVDRSEHEGTAQRSNLYALLSAAFRFPTEEFWQEASGGEFARKVAEAASGLPFRLSAEGLTLPQDLSYDDLQGRYIELFEVGGPAGAPCFLYEGEYGGGRLKVMEEVLRFYHHFGLRMSEEHRDRPDHFATELEFLHALTFKETEARLQGKDPAPYVLAQRDFLRWHLADLAGAVESRTGPRQVAFYPALARLTGAFCRGDLAYIEQAAGGK